DADSAHRPRGHGADPGRDPPARRPRRERLARVLLPAAEPRDAVGALAARPRRPTAVRRARHGARRPGRGHGRLGDGGLGRRAARCRRGRARAEGRMRPGLVHLARVTAAELSKLRTLPAVGLTVAATVVAGGSVAALAASSAVTGGAPRDPVGAVTEVVRFVQAGVVLLGVLPVAHESAGTQLRTTLA